MSRSVALLFVVAGCSSSSTPDGPFTGRPWVGTTTVNVACDDADAGDAGAGQSATTTGPSSLSFGDEGSGIGYVADGCTFEFIVSGDTATLSNGPVMCNIGGGSGTSIEATVTEYTLTRSGDGHELTTSARGTAMLDGMTCDVTITAAASR